MTLKNAALGVLAGAVFLTLTPNTLFARAPLSPAPSGLFLGAPGQDPWAVPPRDYSDNIRRQGFHDGIEGARKDFQNHRRPNVNNRDEYRHPNMPGPARHAYREAFRRGYDVGVQHIMNGGPRR
jgi:hypothetical protein